jgi:hypothetical protein
MKLVAVSLALVGCAAVPAAAAPTAPPCASVVDDQRGLVETTAGAPWRDLLSAAVGSDDREVTVLLQLRELPARASGPARALVDYTMRFTVGGATVFLTAPAHEGAAASYGVEVGHRPVVLGEARVVRDRNRQQLRVTAPIDAFAPLADLRPGGTASRMAALVAVTPSLPGGPAVARAQTVIVDGADGGTRTYRLGAASCARPGG